MQVAASLARGKAQLPLAHAPPGCCSAHLGLSLLCARLTVCKCRSLYLWQGAARKAKGGESKWAKVFRPLSPRGFGRRAPRVHPPLAPVPPHSRTLARCPLTGNHSRE